MKIEEGFQPVPFVEGHAYSSDPVLPSLLNRLLPGSDLVAIEADLIRLGSEVLPAMAKAGARAHSPKVVQYDQWGRRVDELQTSEGWRELKAIHQQEGMPGIFYERKYASLSRVYGFAKMLLMVGHSREIFCPLSMTDGCARTIELSGTPAMKKYVFPRLISRDPSVAFTSGQWMTERPGGSDVSLTETVAQWTGRAQAIGPLYRLDGFKWFSSATDSDVALALARTGSVKDGARGLSLFLVPLSRPFKPEIASVATRPSPLSNGIFIHRLKDKIGTHELPTAELSLEFTDGYLVGKPGQGVKGITSVLNITRIYSSVGSAGALRRCLSIATAFSKVRAIQSGRQLLCDNPLHVALLAEISLVYRASVHLVFGAIVLLGKVECNTASEEEKARLRVLTPVVKSFAAEKACAAMEHAMTALGGAGYMEENEIGRLIRDSLVEKIWEGTTSVLALDLYRALQDQASLRAFTTWAENIMKSGLSVLSRIDFDLLEKGLSCLAGIYSADIVSPIVHRPAILLSGYVFAALYLLEHATWSWDANRPEKDVDIEVFRRWLHESGFEDALKTVETVRSNSEKRVELNASITFASGRATKM